MQDGPLDMRMDNSSGLTVATWLQDAEQRDIAKILKVYGEEKFANSIARAIVMARTKQPITTTHELATIIAAAVPKKDQYKHKDKYKHPATKSFQALRIFINQELTDLETLLQDVTQLLAINGILAVISFHSLEDRIVKRFINEHTKQESHPKDLPIEHYKIKPANFRKLGKFITPSEQEISANIRSRSAKLRVMQRVG
jgi:16S rRNA (cytosine1402-N4)-methyltransferase